MKKFVYILLFFTVSFVMSSCGQSEQQAIAENEPVIRTAQTAQNAGNVVVSTASIDENNWYHDWDEGLAAAAREKKPIIVDFYTDWCSWCKVMDKETFSTPEVMKIMTEGWIKIKIDAEDGKKKGTFKDQTLPYSNLARAFGVSGYPSYLFFDKAGEPITIVPGYIEKEKFIPMLDYFTKELYTKEINMQEYIESNS